MPQYLANHNAISHYFNKVRIKILERNSFTRKQTHQNVYFASSILMFYRKIVFRLTDRSCGTSKILTSSPARSNPTQAWYDFVFANVLFCIFASLLHVNILCRFENRFHASKEDLVTPKPPALFGPAVKAFLPVVCYRK